MMGRIMVAALAVAVVVGLVGCGGQEPLTRAQFTQRAEHVCKDAMRTFVTSAKKMEARRDLSATQKAALILKELRRVVDEELAALEDLAPPTELETEFADYRDTVASRADMQIQRSEGKPSALTDAAHQRDLDENRKAARLLARLRLKGCN